MSKVLKYWLKQSVASKILQKNRQSKHKEEGEGDGGGNFSLSNNYSAQFGSEHKVAEFLPT